MKVKMYQVDAFTDQVFGGNPACVVPLQEWLPNDVMLKIAQENAVAETAFFLEGRDPVPLKWFTPEIEMDLCGHATLATAHVLINHLDYQGSAIQFDTNSGILEVTRNGSLLAMNFPSRMPVEAQLPAEIVEGINIQPIEVYKSRDYVLLYETEQQVRDIAPDRSIIDQINLDPGGIIVTAKGNEVDFVSRFFTPQASIFEDPVTGSAHCSLIPFWSARLNKQVLRAKQLHARLGELFCEDKGDRVIIAGKAVTYCEGAINL
ncbi:MAG: PhzF family phenazine biosynthesis protein [Bacteroidota bacterium]